MMLYLICAIVILPLYYLVGSWKDWVGIIRNVIQLTAMLIKVKWHTLLHAGKNWNFVDLFESRVDRDRDIIQFITVENDKYITLGMVEDFANQTAHWGHNNIHLEQKNSVCLMAYNKPEYISFWIGMGKIGVTTALINTNITGKGLLHCVDISVCNSKNKLLVIDDEIAISLTSEIIELKSKDIQVVLWSEFIQSMQTQSTARPDKSLRAQVMENDPLTLVFTSGTTGLPKAAKMSSTRLYLVGLPLITMTNLGVGIRSYCCLPLYHGAGGILGVSAVIQTGATMVIRYMDDILKLTYI
jgi:fatty-acyl-CoA synthase